jgi:hypothetical protein
MDASFQQNCIKSEKLSFSDNRPFQIERHDITINSKASESADSEALLEE